ncbi:MmgE/PrpD family protein [Micromonospora sp. WMMD975]|uniref:MmgE/PrpD family protein n=1 Tax=Micromonospora sp. WMMD975 TaxID=3016087 RepID=UPI00249BD565|nr:MmgE/PrpD family protein [Micromonospora sp. WMMD975]WFE36334.1 MmgE/PrpD family protein [Micromonospora sp. WMMD975]
MPDREDVAAVVPVVAPAPDVGRPDGPGAGMIERLAATAAATDWASAPAAVRDRVLDLVADTVAVAALGSGRAELRALAAGCTGSGASTVVGSPHRRPVGDAQFLNGSAIAADQLQDGHRPARGHPASHVVPAVLALAEDRDLTGAELLSSVLAGYQVGVRVGRAMGGTPDGVHDIGTWGQVGAAAGVARLLAPGDVDAARRAIELAGSAVLLSDAATVFAGRTGGHAFLGASVQLGASLGAAAVAGLEPLPGALERHFAAVAARDWSAGGPEHGHEVLAGYTKAHPTCAHLHGVNDAVADIVAATGPLTDVDRVEVRTFAHAARFDTVAGSELAARFSVPTSVAVALLTGALDETTLTTATVCSAPVRDLAARVEVRHDPALDAGYPAGRPARVRVVRADGSELTGAADLPRGDGTRAFDRDTSRTKARRLLDHRFPGHADAVLAAVDGLAAGGDARSLGAALRAAVVA